MWAVFILSLFLMTTMVVDGKFKSLHCTAYDSSYGDFPLCRIKAINRYRNSISDTFRHKQAAEKVRMEVFKRANGWRPFLYNISGNLCDLLDKNNNIIMAIGLAYLKPYLGPNVSCPFKLTIRLSVRILISIKIFNFNFRNRFPIETGEYALRLSFYYRKSLKISVNGSAEYFNYKKH